MNGTAWLAPAGALFGGAAALRASLYGRGLLSRVRLQGPVISVGNLSVGGSGKTPVVALVASTLRDAGVPAAVLSRGYRGTFAGECLIVSDGERVTAAVEDAGDEPVMLARMLPRVVVAVGRRRDGVGRVVEARFGPRVHVLDDGFQHLRLERDLDLLCVDAADLADRPLPAGRLRERPSAASRADLVLLWQCDRVVPSPLEAVAAEGRLFRARRRVEGLFDPDGAPRPAPGRAYLLSGIARPERFAEDAGRTMRAIVGHARFPDHHAFTASEIARVAADAHAAAADAIVTTAKDAVRLPANPPGPPVLVLRVAAEVDDGARFRERLIAAARRS